MPGLKTLSFPPILYLTRHTAEPAGVSMTYSRAPSASFRVTAVPAFACLIKARTRWSVSLAIPPAIAPPQSLSSDTPHEYPLILLDYAGFRKTMLDEING